MKFLAKHLLLMSFVISVVLTGCGGFIELKGNDYPESALINYEAGLEYLANENYEIAGKYFQLVKSKYAFSLYANFAELLYADTLRRRDMQIDAISAYKAFQRNHPKHACVSYAQYRVGESLFEQINENWWFMPPAYEKDQELTQKTLYEFKRLLVMEKAANYHYQDDYKTDQIDVCAGQHYKQLRDMIYLAKQRIDYCIERLVERELYVANYYLARNKPNGAVGRLETMFKRYPDTSEKLEYVVLLAESYRQANMYKKVRNVLSWIVIVFPESEEAQNVATTLAEIDLEEQEFTTKRDAKLLVKQLRTEAERPEKEKEGISELDPNPDPNASSYVPLPDPMKM